MNILDWIFLGIIIILALHNMFKGFVASFMSMAAFVTGLLAAILFYRPVGNFLNSLLGIVQFGFVPGFLACFILVFLLVKVLEKSIQNVLENLNLGFLDSGLGFLYGIAQGVLVISIILIILRYQTVFNIEKLMSGSFFARFLLPLIAEAIPKSGATSNV